MLEQNKTYVILDAHIFSKILQNLMQSSKPPPGQYDSSSPEGVEGLA